VQQAQSSKGFSESPLVVVLILVPMIAFVGRRNGHCGYTTQYVVASHTFVKTVHMDLCTNVRFQQC